MNEDSSDIQIRHWAEQRTGKPVSSVFIDTNYEEGCPTCGDSSVEIEVYVSFADGTNQTWTFTDFHNLLREILAA